MGLYSSLNGFGTPEITFIVGSGDTDEFRLNVDLSAFSGSQDLTTGATFRLYGYGATSGAGTLRLGIDGSSAVPGDLRLSADVSPLTIPEPTTLTLLAFAAAGLGARRWTQGR